MATETAPKTLQQAILFFADYDNCHKAVSAIRWPAGVVRCPHCDSDRVTYLENARRWKCYGKHAKAQFSLKVGTIFEDSAISLEKWLPALWLLTNCKNGISSYELARALGVTQKTAWFMLSRLRLALQAEDAGKIRGDVEVDETFIGGKARNMHKAKRDRLGISQSRSMIGKVAVMGLLERHSDAGSQVRVGVIANRRKHQLEQTIGDHVDLGSTIYTDALRSYDRMAQHGYVHHVIDHAEAYVDGQVHTNGLENFWSLLKRALKGTYVSVEPFHLFRYLDEQAYRFNNRKMTDAARLVAALRGVLGKRLTYSALTGSEVPQTC
ncbi:MAG: IS1595 family transposase [Acidobacteria bacterium]|nr:IS1595 family transposase [Acidobacteriota bacterium]MCA1648982.1 IS1595 family transposase [Acidobacteriota bacterium]